MSKPVFRGKIRKKKKFKMSSAEFLTQHVKLKHILVWAPERVISKQCRPRSDAVSPLFANSPQGISKSHSMAYLKFKFDSSNI